MPLRYVHDLRKRRFVVTLTGEVTLAELASFVADQITMGGWKSGVLYNATAPGTTLQSLQTTPMDLWRELNEEHGHRGHVAFVVADDRQRAIAAAYVEAAAKADLFRAAVFSEVSAGEKWLDEQGARSDQEPPGGSR
jgi:hypothetical protein